MRETRVRSLGREDPLEKEMATPVFLPGKSYGLRILVGYSPWTRKESDTTEQLHFTSLLPLKKEMATHSSITAWKIPWTEEPGGLQTIGSQESDTT